ncbi:uncharacterized protein LOC144000948 isoform X2 [Festucalex cinctus]
MTAVKVLLVLLAVLPSARGDVRARDPEVEQEEGEGEDWGVISATEETPLMQDGGNYPARSGNWCAFVQKRVVTTAVACGTEKYTIKSQSPCPSGTPDCHLVMYKLSTRPLYRQKQKVTTALLWRCCPGHGGDNCDDIVADAQSDSASSSPIGGSEVQRSPGSLHTAGELPQQQHSDPNREQNDHQGSVNAPHNVSHARFPHRGPNGDHAQHQDRLEHPTRVPNRDHVQHPVHTPHGDHVIRYPVHVPYSERVRDPVQVQDHRDHAQHPVHVQYPIDVQDREPVQNPVHVQHPIQVQDRDHAQHPVQVQNQDQVPHPDRTHEQQEPLHHPGAYEEASPAVGVPPAALPLRHMVALLMSQLQPSLLLFNRSLEQLERRLGELGRDVAELKGARRRERDDLADYERRLDAKVEQSVQQVAALRGRLESELHSQRAMLHYNISNFKTDLDFKIKRHGKMLQVSLQAMNATLAELKLDQELEQAQEQEQGRAEQQQEAEVAPPPEEAHPMMSQTSAVWEAIERLDNMVVNNTIRVADLWEDAAATSGAVEQLRGAAKALGERVNQTARTGQVLFMETGLEVEAAKVTVLERVERLAANLSRQGQRLLEMDVDVDYLYTALYRNNSSTPSAPCDCVRLAEALGRLEGGVANATELANENRRALEEEEARTWGAEAAVEALRGSLRQVKESMMSEQNRTTTLESSVRHLSVLLQETRARTESRQDSPKESSSSSSSSSSDNENVRAEMTRVLAEMKRLSASFNSLLKDAIRHSDVLEILLGEEVLEFLEWPVHDQEAHSIPALRQNIGILQRALGAGNRSLAAAAAAAAALAGDAEEEEEEAPPADEPSSRSARHGGDDGGGGDLRKLERIAEELRLQLLRAEEEGAELRTEVARLKRGLEEHLRTFKSVFSNADVLERSRAALELDKLQRMLAAKEERKKRGGGGGRGGRHRNRREAPTGSHARHAKRPAETAAVPGHLGAL